MPYRHTENVARRLAARRVSIIEAALAAASEGGMAAVQIAPVARRAGIAAGTVYRYFPGKAELVAALFAEISDRETQALRQAADAAPGPLSALAAFVMTFAGRALHNQPLAYAATGESIESELEAVRGVFCQQLAATLSARIATAVAGGHLPQQDAALAAAAVLGLLVKSLTGPLAPGASGRERDIVQSLALMALRALGVPDARARGVVISGVRGQ